MGCDDHYKISPTKWPTLPHQNSKHTTKDVVLLFLLIYVCHARMCNDVAFGLLWLFSKKEETGWRSHILHKLVATYYVCTIG